MNVLVGVSGGIAAYKACDLVSRLVGSGHAVRVVMTTHATRFVTPLTFEALSAHPVLVDTFAGAGATESGAPGTIDHVNWAKWAEAVVVAPASANTLARIACGMADDALSTVLLAVPAGVPALLAPAMNTAMWTHPATVRNMAWIAGLARYGVLEPVSKRLACGDVGPGALAPVEDILAWVHARAAER